MSSSINVSKQIKILDEGVLLTSDVSQIDFTGGVTATTSGNNVTVNVPAAGITVGTTPVTSGTDGRVFFQAGGVVQQDANFTFDNTLKRLTLKAVGTAATDIPFAVQNSAGSANLMQVAGDNTMTFLSSGGKIIFSQDTVGQGSVISLRRDFSNQEIIRLDGTNGGGITINPLNDGSVKSVAIGSVANGLSMWTTGLTSHNFQIKNSFHNLFHVVGDPNSATATFRIGTIASNTNFFNVHGRNAGGTGLTTNPIFTINSSGTVGIGTEASTPGARLDVRAQGALSTDIAFRVRNSADTRDLFNIRGNRTIELLADTPATNGGLNITSDAYNAPIINFYDVFSNMLRIDASNRLIGVTGNGNIQIGSFTTTGYLGMVTPSTNNRFLKLVDAFTNEYLSIGGNTYDGGGGISMTLKTTTNNGTNFITFSRNNNTNKFVISDQANVGIGQDTFGTSAKYVLAIANGTAPTTSPSDAYQQYSADITAGNAAPHFRTENGAIVKVYQETTAVAAATLVSNAGTNITDTDTFDGYTLKQIVKALRNQGLLA